MDKISQYLQTYSHRTNIYINRIYLKYQSHGHSILKAI